MSQFLRPDGNVTQTNFTNGYTAIDESSANDSDFAYSTDDAVATLEVSLSNPSGTPGSGTNTLRYRYTLTNAGVAVGAAIIDEDQVLTVSLVEGGTIIAGSGAITSISGGSWHAGSFTFASSAISDWNDLRIRFAINPAGVTGFGCGISWAEVEAQDAPAPVAFDPTDVGTTAPGSTDPTLGAVYAFDPTDVGTGSPTVGTPTLNGSSPPHFDIGPLFTGSPGTGSPVFLDQFPFDPDRLHTGRPVLGMPVLIVAPAVPASKRYHNFFFNSSSCVVQIECVEFIHPDFSVTHRVVRNVTAGVTVKHEDGIDYAYAYYPLRILPSHVTNDLDFGLKIEFGDLGEALPQELDLIAQADSYGTKPIVKYRVYRSDNLNQVLQGPLVMEVSEFNFTKDGASFEALARKMNISRTGEIYTLTRFPPLRGFL